jgi:hypothetical protein
MNSVAASTPQPCHHNIRLGLVWTFEKKTSDALQKAARQWLLTRENNFYHSRTHAFVQRWQKTVEKDED